MKYCQISVDEAIWPTLILQTHPKYDFEYKVDDPHTHDHKIQHEKRDGDHVENVYSVHKDNDKHGRLVTHFFFFTLPSVLFLLYIIMCLQYMFDINWHPKQRP